MGFDDKRKNKRKKKRIFLNKKKGQFIWAARSPNRLPFADNLGWWFKWAAPHNLGCLSILL